MSDYTSVVQRTFIRGVNATVSNLDQPRGSIPRISNLYYNNRGSLQTVPGTQLLTDFGTLVAECVDWLFFKFQDSMMGNYYAWLNRYHSGAAITTPLPAITLTGVNVVGGTLVPGNTYFYQITAVSYGQFVAGNPETLVGAEVSLLLPGGMNAIRIDWTGQLDAGGYMVYGRVGGGNNKLLANTVVSNIPSTTLSYTDAGAAVTATNPPIVDTSIVSQFHKAGTGSLINFPAAPFFPLDDSASNPIPKITEAGGIVGNPAPSGKILPFTNKLLLIASNGWPIYIYDGTTFTKISNTFTAQYPTWQGTVAWVIGDFVKPTVPNTFYYKCVQAGTNGAAEPAWPTIVGQRVLDGKVVWECVGLITTSPAPPGTAFAVVHAGSLWVYNTWPTNTSDGLDGPSALRMSDVNNPTSWNPLNAAFIDKDDGSQGMGMATFTISETGIPPTGSLVLFKQYSTYQVVGVFGSPNFSIQRVQTDMGCVAPDTIKFLPGFGIVRLTHLGWAVFDGVRDRLISEEIRPYILQSTKTDIVPAPTSTTHLTTSAQSSNPPMYLAAGKYDNLSVGFGPGAARVFMYDLVLRTWSITDTTALTIDTGNTLWGVIKQIRNLLTTPTVTAFMTYVGGKLYRWMEGDTKFYEPSVGPGGNEIPWSFRTPEVFSPSSPTQRLYIRRMLIRGINTSNSGIIITLTYQYENSIQSDQPQTITLGNGLFEIEVGVGVTCINAHADISGSGVVEIESIEWQVKPMPSKMLARSA